MADCAESFSGEMRQDHQSLASVESIIGIVKEMGHDCDYYGGIDELMKAHLRRQTFDDDEIMLNFSDGLTQTYRLAQSAFLMEVLEVPYSGHDPFSLSLATNKHYCKMIVESLGCCRVPKGCLLTRYCSGISHLGKLPYPCLVKPNLEGGSIGISQDSIAKTPDQALEIAKGLLAKYQEVLIEEFVPGIDITNLLIGNNGNFGINKGLSYYANGSYYQEEFIRSFEAKANLVCEKHTLEAAGLSPSMVEEVGRTSERIFEAVGSRDFARIDYRIDAEGNLVFLEINALPMLEPGDPFTILYDEMSFEGMIRCYVEAVLGRMSLRMT